MRDRYNSCTPWLFYYPPPCNFSRPLGSWRTDSSPGAERGMFSSNGKRTCFASRLLCSVRPSAGRAPKIWISLCPSSEVSHGGFTNQRSRTHLDVSMIQYSVPLCFVYPPLLHYKACARTRKEKAGDIALMVFGALAAVYTTVQTIKVGSFIVGCTQPLIVLHTAALV